MLKVMLLPFLEHMPGTRPAAAVHAAAAATSSSRRTGTKLHPGVHPQITMREDETNSWCSKTNEKEDVVEGQGSRAFGEFAPKRNVSNGVNVSGGISTFCTDYAGISGFKAACVSQ